MSRIPDYVEDWLSTFKAVKTRRQYRRAVRRLVRGLSAAGIDDLREAKIRVVNKIAESPAINSSPSLYNQTIYAWRSLYDWMIGEEMTTSNPAKYLRSIRCPHTPQPCPTIAEVQLIWKALNSKQAWRMADEVRRAIIVRDRYIFAMLLSTAVRSHTLVTLRKRDFDRSLRMIKITHKRNKIEHKPWPEALDRYVVPVLDMREPDDWMLPSPTIDGAPLNPESASNRVKSVCVDIGIPPYGAHAFRRFAITRALREQGEVAGRDLGGHEKLSTTLEVYDMDRFTPRISGNLYDDVDESGGRGQTGDSVSESIGT